jgi:hypothetical protein
LFCIITPTYHHYLFIWKTCCVFLVLQIRNGKAASEIYAWILLLGIFLSASRKNNARLYLRHYHAPNVLSPGAVSLAITCALQRAVLPLLPSASAFRLCRFAALAIKELKLSDPLALAVLASTLLRAERNISRHNKGSLGHKCSLGCSFCTMANVIVPMHVARVIQLCHGERYPPIRSDS